MDRVESTPDQAPAQPVDAAIEPSADLTSATDAAALAVPPALAAQSLGEFARARLARMKSGDSGVLPVLAGIVVIAVVFQAITPDHVFLSASNIVNLFQQSAVFMVLAMGQCFVLLLGEIDLSVGYVGPFAGIVTVQLVQPATTNWPWYGAIAAGLLGGAIVGLVIGTLVTRLHMPSFIVTLAFFLIFNGVDLIVLGFGPFSGYPTLSGNSPNVKVINNLMYGNVDPGISWIVMGVIVVGLGASLWLRDAARRRSGLVAPPQSLTVLKIVLIAIVGVAVVAVCNVNRAHFGTIAGVPWVIFIVLGVLGIWMLLLERTRFGRYVYAIGGNAEAARRAGINLARIRTLAFVLCSMTAGLAGMLFFSYLSGASNNINGGQLTLYSVAAAVIGGTSLFGGRGRVLHGVLGGLVIGGIYNGLYLLGLDAQWQFIVTGLVLLVAVAIDSFSRRGAGGGAPARV